MRILASFFLGSAALAAVSLAVAQGPPNFRAGPPESADNFVSRLMAFDTDKDGKLAKSEITETRLLRLFDRADSDKDGVVTKEELSALAAREGANDRDGPSGFGHPPGGPGGRGGPMMTPPRPGEILPAMLRRSLNLTDEQEKQLDELQKDVDTRLAKILTSEQAKTLREMRMRFRGPGPGGPPRGGLDRFRPDGPPPDEQP